MKFRRIVSLFMLVAFLFTLITSVILYIVPQGRVAYWSGWKLWGLTKTDWGNLHINLGLFLLIAAILHTYYNWKPITSYLKNRSRRLVVFTGEFTISAVVVLSVLIGTQLGAPPFCWVLDLNEAVKDAAAVRHGEPPYGHAELSTLKTFTRRVDLDLDEVLPRLSAAGYAVESPGATLESIAEANGTTPRELYETMRRTPDGGEAPKAPRLPKIPAPGTGKKRLIDLCSEYGLEMERVLGRLSTEGITAAPGQTLREIAEENDLTPDEIYEAIRLSEKQ